MNLWRIAADTRTYAADDLSGQGSALHPGRWNDSGQALVYAAPSIATAVLETAAHVDDGGLPLNRYLVRINVPEELWAAREEVAVAALPASWAAIPAGHASVRFGTEWLASKRSPILLLPSVVVPEERIALVHPGHPLNKGISAHIVRLFEYNRLFRS